MPLQIEMRGKLDVINLPGNFQHFVDQVNLSAAKGMQYIIVEDHDGKHIALNQQNILFVQEVDDDLIGMAG
jgi:hypothetical protein